MSAAAIAARIVYGTNGACDTFVCIPAGFLANPQGPPPCAWGRRDWDKVLLGGCTPAIQRRAQSLVFEDDGAHFVPSTGPEIPNFLASVAPVEIAFGAPPPPQAVAIDNAPTNAKSVPWSYVAEARCVR